jgi:8-oxo-dGTP pyrophosphatase MutT (NUDIX family)
MALADALDRHVAADSLEALHLEAIRAFVAAQANPFDRDLPEGHVTGSAFVVSADGARVLLVRHRRLDCWLQPGGHAEPGEQDAEAVALREAREETGIDGLVLHPSAPRPLDVDVHRVPGGGRQPAHDHFDVRYLVVAPDGAEPAPQAAETAGARWFTWAEIDELPLDRPMRRALGKIRRCVGGEAPT